MSTILPSSRGATAAHTPGPWTIGKSCDGTPAVTIAVPKNEGSGFVVAHINRLPRMGSVRGDMEANARLIAAAPDLLAATQLARVMFLEMERGIAPSRADFAKIESAIRKAGAAS